MSYRDRNRDKFEIYMYKSIYPFMAKDVFRVYINVYIYIIMYTERERECLCSRLEKCDR